MCVHHINNRYLLTYLFIYLFRHEDMLQTYNLATSESPTGQRVTKTYNT